MYFLNIPVCCSLPVTIIKRVTNVLMLKPIISIKSSYSLSPVLNHRILEFITSYVITKRTFYLMLCISPKLYESHRSSSCEVPMRCPGLSGIVGQVFCGQLPHNSQSRHAAYLYSMVQMRSVTLLYYACLLLIIIFLQLTYIYMICFIKLKLRKMVNINVSKPKSSKKNKV